MAESSERVPYTYASCGRDKSWSDTSPRRRNWRSSAVISRCEQVNWSTVPFTSISNVTGSLKCERIGTKGEISFKVICDGNVRKEKRTCSVKRSKAFKLSYIKWIVSSFRDVSGNSIAKLSMLVCLLLATSFRLIFFKEKPDTFSSRLNRLIPRFIESLLKAFNEILAIIFWRWMCLALNFPGVSSSESTW